MGKMEHVVERWREGEGEGFLHCEERWSWRVNGSEELVDRRTPQSPEAVVMSGPGCCRGPRVSPWLYCSCSLYWYICGSCCPQRPSDANDLGCCLRPHWCLEGRGKGHTDAGGQTDLSGLCYYLRPRRCLGPGCHWDYLWVCGLATAGSVLLSVASVTIKGHVDVYGLRCNMWMSEGHADVGRLIWVASAFT